MATFSAYIHHFHLYAHCRVIQNTLLEFTDYVLFLINIMFLSRKISGYSKAFNSTDLFFTFSHMENYSGNKWARQKQNYNVIYSINTVRGKHTVTYILFPLEL